MRHGHPKTKAAPDEPRFPGPPAAICAKAKLQVSDRAPLKNVSGRISRNVQRGMALTLLLSAPFNEVSYYEFLLKKKREFKTKKTARCFQPLGFLDF